MRWKYSDGGRDDAAMTYQEDCAVRSLCILVGADYRSVWDEMTERNVTAGGLRLPPLAVHRQIWQPVFTQHGLKRVSVKHLGTDGYPTFEEVAREHPRCIVHAGSHLAAIVDGVLNDCWDSSVYDWVPRGKSRLEIMCRKVRGAYVSKG